MPTTLDPSNKNPNATLSNGNLTITTTPAAYSSGLSTTSKSSGKWYFEITVNSIGNTVSLGNGAFTVGLAQGLPGAGGIPGQTLADTGWDNFNMPSFYYNNVQHAVAGNAQLNNVIRVAVDFTNKNVWVWTPSTANWNSSGTDNPATNTGGLNGSGFYNGAMTTGNLFASPLFACLSAFDSSKMTINFGDSAFAFAIPAGFQAWDTITNPKSGMMFAAP